MMWALALGLGCTKAPEPPGNHLAGEPSPYLRLHAQDPVDWYPWGDEAFARARALDRPVLLSIGYATCHWCHVMADESFRDPEIAAWLDDHYVAIKVDREERPDVDAIYMTALLATGAPGGWPLTVWVTPDGEPFYATSYLPARDGDRGRDTGFLTVLQRLSEAWETDRAGVAQAARELGAHLRAVLEPPPVGDRPGEELLAAEADRARQRYDPVNGGRRGAPKFPSGLPLRFLLKEHRRTGATDLRDLAVHTLRAMAGGGLRDPIGGGFHRYATDEAWRVPHFEKMLYDNALLAAAYVDAFLVTDDPDLERVARETLAWAARELPGRDGPFGSALDADSEGEEGRYYTWTAAEVQAVLGPEATPAALAFWGIEDGRSVPAAAGAPTGPLEDARQRLLTARERRPKPLRDDKAVLGWNALMAEAFVRAGLALEDPALLATGVAAVDALIRDRYTRVLGQPEPPPMVEDLAFLTSALITTFEATADPRTLTEAIRIDRDLLGAYADPRGGWYRAATDELVARERPDRDGAEPAGASVHVDNLLRLAALTGDDAYRVRADRALSAYAEPLGAGRLPEMLRALDRRLDADAKEVVIVVPRDRAEAAPFVSTLLTRGPRNHVLVVVEQARVAEVAAVAPIVAGKLAVDDRATAYVCSAGVCRAPTTDPAALSLR